MRANFAHKDGGGCPFGFGETFEGAIREAAEHAANYKPPKKKRERITADPPPKKTRVRLDQPRLL